jgi:hypothetical protein
VRPSVIKIAAWGEWHVRMMERCGLACLLTQGNIPALSKMSPTRLEIYVDRTLDADLLRRLGECCQLAVVNLDLPSDLPNSPNVARQILARIEHASLKNAHSLGADWFFVQCDTLISSDFLSRVKARLQQYDAVCAAPFRASLEGWESIGSPTDFDAAALYQFSLAHMHKITLGYFMQNPPSIIPADPHQLFFNTTDGFSCYAWLPNPYGVNTAALPPPEFDGMTADCRLLMPLNRERILYQIDPPGEFYMTGLDTDAGITSFGDRLVTTETVVKSMHIVVRTPADLDFSLWALRHRTFYPGTPTLGLPQNGIDENAAISEILRLA